MADKLFISPVIEVCVDEADLTCHTTSDVSSLLAVLVWMFVVNQERWGYIWSEKPEVYTTYALRSCNI